MQPTKEEKVLILSKAMEIAERENGTQFVRFTETAPQTLKYVFMEHYEVRDVDYKIFYDACNVLHEILTDNPELLNDRDDLDTEIYERVCESASIYTSDRLEYLNVWNQDEISDIFREYNLEDIATACAVWYDRQVEQAAILVSGWVLCN